MKCQTTFAASNAAVSPPPPDGGLTSVTETAQMWKNLREKVVKHDRERGREEGTKLF